MRVTIKVEIDRSEAAGFNACFNVLKGEYLTDEEIIDYYEQIFWSNKQEYIDAADFDWELV